MMSITILIVLIFFILHLELHESRLSPNCDRLTKAAAALLYYIRQTAACRYCPRRVVCSLLDSAHAKAICTHVRSMRMCTKQTCLKHASGLPLDYSLIVSAANIVTKSGKKRDHHRRRKQSCSILTINSRPPEKNKTKKKQKNKTKNEPVLKRRYLFL